jgi:cytoskeleton protein RodZ
MERLPAPEQQQEEKNAAWAIPVGIAAVCVVGAVALFYAASGTREGGDRVEAAHTAPPKVEAPAPAIEPPRVEEPAPAPASPGRVELKATEPTWIAIAIDGKQTTARVLDTGQMEIIESGGTIRVRLGNAGGVEISANGKPIGPVGAKGQVKIVEFKGAGFRVVPLDK